jgi:hypothetical protein
MCFFFNPGPVRRVPIPNRYTAKAKLCFCKNNKRRIINGAPVRDFGPPPRLRDRPRRPVRGRETAGGVPGSLLLHRTSVEPPWSFGFDCQTRGTRENRRRFRTDARIDASDEAAHLGELQIGDMLVEVEGQPISAASVYDAASLLLGPPGNPQAKSHTTRRSRF